MLSETVEDDTCVGFVYSLCIKLVSKKETTRLEKAYLLLSGSVI